MNTPLPNIRDLIILGLAVYRISRLIVCDTWPPVAKFRLWAKYHWPKKDDTVSRIPKRGKVQPISPQGTRPEDIQNWRVINGTSLGYLLSCMYCLPFWFAVLAWVSWTFAPVVTVYIALPWALATIGTLVHRWESTR